jgi:glucose/mannose-6-phosphate isomerase
MSELDDPQFLSSIDRSNMLKVLLSFPENCERALEIGMEFGFTLPRKRLNKILFLGMGGSAIGGSLIKDWAYSKSLVPIEVCRDYVVPAYVDNRTLVFAVSYSGDTEETLSAFSQALDKGCFGFGLSSGGFLEKLCAKRGIPWIKVPEGFQPRAALPYLFIPPLIILEKLGVIEGVKNDVRKAVEVLIQVRENIKASTPIERNLAKKLASQIFGTFPLIIGFREFSNVAYRFKDQLNENSKILSKFEVLPELNHNEVVGWEGISPELAKLISVIFIRDADEPLEIKTRIEVTKKIMNRKTNCIYEVRALGGTKLAKMLSTIYVCDFISFYLAILNRKDPTPVRVIVEMKDELEKIMKFHEKFLASL